MITVSTIIPAYNAAYTITQAVDSALSQDCDGHEVIVVDDGSTDMTGTILGNYGSRIHAITQPNTGVSAARNAGVLRSTGKYLAFLDADDMWLPGKLTTMLNAVERSPSVSLGFSNYLLMDGNGSISGRAAFDDPAEMERLLRDRPLPVFSFPAWILPSTWIIPRDVFTRVGGFSDGFKGAGFDDAWMLLLLREAGEFLHVPAETTCYRIPQRTALADKYGAGVNVFISLVQKHFKAEGNPLIRAVKAIHCWHIFYKASAQFKSQDRFGALLTIGRIARFWPPFLLSSEFRRNCLYRKVRESLNRRAQPQALR